MHITTSAPGKLVLLGEYAVLFGHPALVMAADRRARVEFRPVDGDNWRVSAPGFCDEGAEFALGRDRGLAWSEPDSIAAGQMVLVERVLASLIRAGQLDPDGLAPASITLDTREFFQSTADGTAKLGLGSSAALTVALTDAMREWVPERERRTRIELRELLQLHRTFQGGRGSGIDLAASSIGGVVEYRLSGRGDIPEAGSVELPTDLVLVPVWTGRSASTGDFLRRLETGMQTDTGAIAASLGELGRLSAMGIGHIRTGETEAFLDIVDAFSAAMEALGSATGIPVLSAEHLELLELAKGCGVRYKPSGAGGGDVGLAFTDNVERAGAFATGAAKAGFPPLNLEIDPIGLDTRIDTQHS